MVISEKIDGAGARPMPGRCAADAGAIVASPGPIPGRCLRDRGAIRGSQSGRNYLQGRAIQLWFSVDRGSIQGRYPRAPAGSGNRVLRSPETDLCFLKKFLRLYQIIQQIPWDPTGVGTVTHSHRHSTPHIAHCTVGNSQSTWYMPSGNLRRVAPVLLALSR